MPHRFGIRFVRPRLAPAVWALVAPDEIVFKARFFARGLQEPVVLIGNVVDDQIEDDLDPAFVRFGDEGFEVGHRAVVFFDRVKILKIVAVVRRRLEHRREPDRIDAEIAQVIEFRDHPFEIAVAVAVAVLERTRPDLVHGGVVPPVQRAGIEFDRTIIVGRCIVGRCCRALCGRRRCGGAGLSGAADEERGGEQ